MTQRHFLFSAVAASALVCATGALAADTPNRAAPAPAVIPAYVAAAVADAARPPVDTAQDAVRKPAQALAFARIAPGMVVADFVPEQGYYTRILSKLVGAKGKVYAIVPMVGGFAPSIIRKKDEDLRAAGKEVPPLSADKMMEIGRAHV